MMLGCMAAGCEEPETLQHACEDYCGQVEKADCDNGAGRETCEQDCVDKGTLFEQCTPAWRDYVACMSAYQLTCDADGLTKPPASACENAQKKLDACVSDQFDKN